MQPNIAVKFAAMWSESEWTCFHRVSELQIWQNIYYNSNISNFFLADYFLAAVYFTCPHPVISICLIFSAKDISVSESFSDVVM